MSLQCPSDIAAQLSLVAETNVSRETLSLIELYLEKLKEASDKQNLLGPKEWDRIWSRHVLDSAQLYPLVKRANATALTDLGAGGGFPGVVLSALGGMDVHLVESSQKKCRFLEHVSRETSLPLHVVCQRVESLAAFPSRAIVSRALAPVHQVLSWGSRLWRKEHCLFLLKGQQAAEELLTARSLFRFDVESVPSKTSEHGTILVLQNIKIKK